MGRTAVLEKVRLVAFIVALGLTVVAGFVWLAPDDTATIRAASGNWVGIDCSGDRPVGRSFRTEHYRVADAQEACDDLDAANTRSRSLWTIAAAVAWVAAYAVTRIPEHPAPRTVQPPG